jgi:AcrR family transcriptional regulator
MKDNDNKDKIVAAAAICFGQFGYDKTTMADIGSAAGMDKTTLYYYFNSKEDIYLAVAVGLAGERIAALQSGTLAKPVSSRRIAEYLKGRDALFLEIIRLHKMTRDSFQKNFAQFRALYDAIEKQETEFLAGLIDEFYASKKSAKKATAELVAFVLTACESFKMNDIYNSRSFLFDDLTFDDTYRQIDNLIEYTLEGVAS